ncbi:fibroblast growth factor receptor 3-like [Stylophora pistillata]|uniref:fibroblast growth factor receptor 3-like n=1 Tax=Stylophora pistillata TaxID=50429 RepID=UPI000C054ECA|nr:fibroblast growth factor receptor 3-like [Stylophora pistillata]
MTRMLNTHRLGDAGNCLLLLFVTSALTNLSPAEMTKKCNRWTVIPEMNISSSPPNRALALGEAINMTCVAWPKPGDKLFPRRRIKYIQWDDSRGRSVGIKCQDSKLSLKVLCTLPLKRLTLEQFGNYTCEAENDYDGYCRQKTVEIRRQAFLVLETVDNPKNQTVIAGINVTLNCTAKGHPMPFITWRKNNGTLAFQSNPRRKVIEITLDDERIHSQLVIDDVKNEDKGKYHCVANNTAGEKASNLTFLFIEDLDNWARIVEDPVNQTSFFGSNVTFNCSAAGLPKPIITWFKNNNSNALDSNPRARVIQISLEDKTITQSQLSIRGVKEEDEGKYYCVTKGSAGEAASKYAFLFIKHLGQLRYLAKAPPRKDRNRSVSLITALSVFGGTMITFMCGCTMAFLYRRARSNEDNMDGKEINVICTTYKDLAEGIPKHENADTNGSAPSVVNVVAPLEDVEKRNTSMHLKRKYHAQDDGNADSILRASSEGSKIPTPPDVGDKHLRNLIFEKHDHAEKLLNSRGGHLNAAYSCSDVNLNLHQDSGSDQMLTSLNIKLEEREKGVDDLQVLDEVLGEGEYGIVYKGRYGGKNGSITDVAVKKLKDNAGTLAKAALLNEIRTLKQAGRHPNIVNLIGTWTHGETTLVVTELVRGGSLESLLRSKDDGSSEYANVCCKLNDRQLLNIALQVAFGMQHLEERKCIHCDLAARNVFINPNMVAKVGDFGLARNISDDGLYIKTSCGKVPWRWSSLESLRDRVYTSQSDVWSFGILLWEIATYGKVPYPDVESPFSLVSRLSTGYRMPRPHQCSEELYTLMSSCWNENPLMRPCFTDIVNRLEYFLREVKRTYINIMDDDIRVDEKQKLNV